MQEEELISITDFGTGRGREGRRMYQCSWYKSICDMPRRWSEDLTAETTLPLPNLQGRAANLVATTTFVVSVGFAFCLSLMNLRVTFIHSSPVIDSNIETGYSFHRHHSRGVHKEIILVASEL